MSANATGVTRIYSRFMDVIQETIDAWVYQGLHFRAADVPSAGIGKDVARRLQNNYFGSTARELTDGLAHMER